MYSLHIISPLLTIPLFLSSSLVSTPHRVILKDKSHNFFTEMSFRIVCLCACLCMCVCVPCIYIYMIMVFDKQIELIYLSRIVVEFYLLHINVMQNILEQNAGSSHTHTHRNTQKHTHTHTQTHTHTHTHTRTHTHTHTNTHT